MMEIQCNRGHGIEYHNRDGCNHIIGEKNKLHCPCLLSYAAVEAVYWWDYYQKETYKLRERFIHQNECPNCLSDLKEIEISLPDKSIGTIYHCYNCDKIWSYYGKEL